jgi:ectoine hydroxylase-related dioxygenase (phytanoyl-CoA dioxygenase family)
MQLSAEPADEKARTHSTRFEVPPNRENDALVRTLGRIADMGLEDNLRELEAYGYTVVKGVLSKDKVDRARAAILRRAQGDGDKPIDLETATAEDFHGMTYQHYLLFQDPVFQEILMEPKPLALIDYLLGESCVLSSMGSHARGPGGVPLFVHADNSGPSPYSAISMVANCNYALTSYSREAGALMMFPGSHRKCRSPTDDETWRTTDGLTLQEIMVSNLSGDEMDALQWVPPAGGVTMNLDPGDAVVWHGNSWHAGWRRELPGMRMNLATFFCRPHFATQERRPEKRFPEVFARYGNEPRFAQLLGEKTYFSWREEGPDLRKMQYTPTGQFD